jgi:(p)ppGpp synthase/HD superfamily hydrolase
MQLTSRFEEALIYAVRLHSLQMRKGGTVPYISHLLGVASIVMEYGGNEDEAMAALLHDAVEDQGGIPRLEEIRGRFGENVADIVAGCTDSLFHQKSPWRERKEQYLAHLPTSSASIRMVSCADKIQNGRAILKDLRLEGDELWSRFRGGKEGTFWYYRSLSEIFCSLGPKEMALELCRIVDEIEEFYDQKIKPLC